MEKAIVLSEKTNRQFSIKWLERTGKPYDMPLSHYHEDLELYYLLEGERNFFIKDKIYHIRKGDLVFISSNEIHRTTNAKISDHTKINVLFKEEFIKDLCDSMPDIHPLSDFCCGYTVLRPDLKDQLFIENAFSRLLEEHQKSQIGSEAIKRLILLDLLIFIRRSIDINSTSYFEHPISLHAKISEIAKFINQNYMQNISLKIISDTFFISPHYFCKLFREVTGFTFVEYLNSIRIREAKRLLVETKSNITEIMEVVGFQNSTHFGRVFKSMTGLSPLKFRKSGLRINI